MMAAASTRFLTTDGLQLVFCQAGSFFAKGRGLFAQHHALIDELFVRVMALQKGSNVFFEPNSATRSGHLMDGKRLLVDVLVPINFVSQRRQRHAKHHGNLVVGEEVVVDVSRHGVGRIQEMVSPQTSVARCMVKEVLA